MLAITPVLLLSLCFESLLLNLETTIPATPAGQRDPEVCLFVQMPPVLGLQVFTTTSGFLWVLGI